MPLYGKNFPGPLSTVAIFGPGLIGGSLAFALRQRQPDTSLRLWARSERSAETAARFFPDVSRDPRAVAAQASLCVFCTPIGAMPALAREIADVLPADCVVTDAGSVKAGVVSELESILGSRFVGSHPMAGSERSGMDAAQATLFNGAAAIVTPTPQSSPAAVAAVRTLWESVGCHVLELSPSEHDQAVARISHLPHAVAAALVNSVSSQMPKTQAIVGGGYRDTTRIAAGSPPMWTEILLENKTALLAGLDDFSTTLKDLKKLLADGDAAALEAFLARAQKSRGNLS